MIRCESKVCTYKETWGNNVGHTRKPAAWTLIPSSLLLYESKDSVRRHQAASRYNSDKHCHAKIWKERSSPDVSDSQLFLIDKVEVRKDFLEIKFQISGTRRHGNKVSSFSAGHDQNLPNHRAQDTLDLGGSCDTHKHAEQIRRRLAKKWN